MTNLNHKNYRDNGAIGALLDEYERAISDLKECIANISSHHLAIIADTETKDEDCRSIQTILTHVLRAGYGYAIYIRNHQGETLPPHEASPLDSTALYRSALDAMFLFTEQVFKDYPYIMVEEYDVAKKIHVRWGQKYDVDQLMEHAIVHILRHRRQIERFLLKDVYKK